MMLSRDADACYWIGRYVERAEATARMVDVHYHATLETFLPTAHESAFEPEDAGSLSWQPILAISGGAAAFAKRYGKESDRSVLHYFAFDMDNADSILSVWTAARENARSIRELIASEMWEAINISYLEMREWDVDRILRGTPHEFFRLVRNASHLFQGILNRTMMMGEGREWLDTGRFLERSCQTARLLDVKYHDLLPATTRPSGGSEASAEEKGLIADPFGVGGPLDTHGWIAVLKSVSAFEMYCKTHRDGIRPSSVVDFLVMNPHFPASVRHGVGRIEGCLRRISGTSGEQMTEPERLIGRLRADLTYTHPGEIIANGLHTFLAGVQSRFNAIGESIARTYLY